MKHFHVFAYPEKPEMAPSWAAGVSWDKNIKDRQLLFMRLDV
jgi:hypothetical protein